MRYYSCSKEDLDSLQPALNILSKIYDSETFFPYLYAVVKQGEVLQSAAAKIQDWAGEEEHVEAPTAIAVGIPLSSDTLHFLLGSGLYLEDEEFAYLTPGEGSRLANLDSRARLYLNQIESMAISEDATWLGEFLESHSPAPTVVPEKPEVKRTKTIETEAPGKQSSKAKIAYAPGIDRLLIAGKPLASLTVTELIEIADFVEDHKSPRSRYLHFEYEGSEWLVYTTQPELGRDNLARVIKNKYNLDEVPKVDILAGSDVEALMESLVEEA
jgi:hypothetical protein